jgi:predicted protein tyrosine phosphatase
MKLIITNRGIAGYMMKNPDKYPGITHILSIGAKGDPLQTVPSGYKKHPAKHKLRLDFWDISDEKRKNMNGPSEKDVKKLIDFFSEAIKSEEEPSFLIHCFAGKSRSTAAGLILLNMFYKDSARARYELFGLVPAAIPNKRMIKLANTVFAEGSNRRYFAEII